MYICIYVYICMYIYVCMYVCICIYIYIYTIYIRCDFVEATWKALASTLKVSMDNTVVNDAPVAWCSMKDPAPAMLDACTTKFKKVDPYQRNEIWLGVGIDGVPLWHSHVISVSTCLLADIDGLPIHGPHSSSPTKKSSQAKGRTCSLRARYRVLPRDGSVRTTKL